MSGVLQIIKTYLDSNNKLKFEFYPDEFKKWVEPVKDQEVIVIPTVGHTQTARSFLLNLFGHKFSNKTIDKLITGFESKTSVDSITTGLWLSKPIVVQQDNGKEVAVLLLDTQSVFDGNTSVEDSNRIMWICLLVSSCLILNVFSTLSEDFLHKLEPFLQYMSSNSGCAESLIFMIRDWNKNNIFKYGRKGGQQYIANRLEIKTTSRALTTKRLLKSMDSVECYLMPRALTDEEEFDGSVETLNPNFLESLKELFSHSLNVNNLRPKMINNESITASHLGFFFKVYVELFNSTEQPNNFEIRTATTETLDRIIIDEIKSQQSIQLKGFISRKKSFVSRKSLFDYNKQICDDLEDVFKLRKKSEYPDVIQRLNELLESEFDTNYKSVYNENERNRMNYMRKVVDDCIGILKILLQKEFECNKFFNSKDLNIKFEYHRNIINKKFNESLNGEEETLFEEELERLQEQMQGLESIYKTENEKRNKINREKNMRAVEEAVNTYKKIQEILDSSPQLSDKQFCEMENRIKMECRQIFLENCTSNDSSFFAEFDNIFRQRISELKYDFKEQMKRKRERIVVDFEIELIDRMHEMTKKCDSKEKLKQKCFIIEEDFIDELKNSGLPKDIISELTETIQTKVEVLSKDFISKPKEELKDRSKEEPKERPKEKAKSSQTLNTLEKTNILEKIKEEYTKTMDNLFISQSLCPPNVLKEMDLKNQAKAFNNLAKALVHLNMPKEEQVKLDKELIKFFDQKFSEYLKKNSSLKEVSDRKSPQEKNEKKSPKMRSNEIEELIEKLSESAINEISEDINPFERKKLKENKSFEELFPKSEKRHEMSTEPTDERPIKSTHLTDGQFLAKIIEITPDGKYQLNEELLSSILSKAKNCNNFALISIIGRKKSSKTFLINCLKNYLETNERKSWPKRCSFQYENGFHSDTNDYSIRPVVQMWGQPFIVESEEQKTAIFLVDTSYVFNDDSEISNTGLVKDIIGLLLNISSTLIFTTDSELMAKEIQTLTALIEENLSMPSFNKFQELICVIRDWDPNQSEEKNLLYGPKSGERFFNQLGNYEINKYFESLSCYLMPKPGNAYKRSTVEFDKLYDQFLVELSNLIRLKLLNIDEMEVKKHLRTERPLNLDQLMKLMRTQLNKLNGIHEEILLLSDSAENWQMYDSGEEIMALDYDSDEE